MGSPRRNADGVTRAWGRLLRALIDPGADKPDLFLGERIAFAIGGHGAVFVEAGDGVDERAFEALALWK